MRSFADGKLRMSIGNLLPWNTIDGEFDSALDPTAPFMVLDGLPIPNKYFVGDDSNGYAYCKSSNDYDGLT